MSSNQSATALRSGRARARLLTINNLPPEMLATIFALANPGGRVTVRPPDVTVPYWCILMAVCPHWRNIIKNIAEFWRIIEVRGCPEWLGLCLERSKQSSVHVRYFRPPSGLPSGLPFGTNFARVMHALAAHKDHIVELINDQLLLGQPPQLVFTPGPMSMLSILYLGVAAPPEPPVDTLALPTLKVVDDKDLPGLQHVTLISMNITVPPSIFARLRTLALADWHQWKVDMKRKDFLSMLRACPSLEQLTLRHTYGRTVDDGQLVQGAGPVASFPNIRVVVIQDTYQAISHLLSHMDLPAHVHLRLTVDQPLPGGAIYEAIAGVLPAESPFRDRLAILSALTHLQIRVSVEVEDSYGGMLNIVEGLVQDGSVCRGSFLLLMPQPHSELQQDSYPIIMRQLPSHFPCGDKLISLVCIGNIDRMGRAEDWSTKLLASYPHLRNLEVDDDELGGSMRPLFEALSSTVPSTGTEQSIPLCPELQRLFIRGAAYEWKTLETIRTCLKTRNARGAPLKEMHLFVKEQDEQDQAIQEHVGDVFTEEERQRLPDLDGYRAEFASLVPSCTFRILDSEVEADAEILHDIRPSILRF